MNFRIPDNLIAPRSTNATEQTIDKVWGSQTNLDYYSVEIPTLPTGVKNGGELLEKIRLNIAQFLDDKTTFA